MANVAEVLVRTLMLSGVERVYGLPGDSLNGITDAIRTHTQVRWVHVRNEEAAAFAAGADAHLTGRLAVCAGSCGPGNLHFINGLYDYHRSRVPVLAIAAQIPSQELTTTYFQETNPEQIFKDCSHYCGVVSEPEQMPRVLAIAMRTAIAKRGVAVIVIPGNISMKTCSAEVTGLGFAENRSGVLHPESDLTAAASLLNGAKRVTILAGPGCEGSHAELLAVADKLQAPIVHAYRGKEFVEYENPFDVGMTGLIGWASGYWAMMHCGAIPKLTDTKDRAHLRDSLEHYTKSRKDLDDLATGEPGSSPLHPQYVAKTLDEMASEDAVFTVM